MQLIRHGLEDGGRTGERLQQQTTAREPPPDELLNRESSCTTYVPRQLSKWKTALVLRGMNVRGKSLVEEGTKRRSMA